MLPRVLSIYCRGEAAATPYPEQQSTKDGARTSGAPRNGPGREFHGDWGARPPHLHPFPPAYPSLPKPPVAALPPGSVPPPPLPTPLLGKTEGRFPICLWSRHLGEEASCKDAGGPLLPRKLPAASASSGRLANITFVDSDVALDILITNVVCVFRTRCHLNLRKIALEGANVIYKRDVGKVLMKLRKPRITATIWSSGKIICTGATSEEEAKFGARRLARSLQKLGFQVIFTDFKVVNVLAVCNMPFEIRLPEFTKNNRPHASYEPELHPAVCYRIKSLRATLQIFSTGSITVTGPNVKAVATAVEQIYPFVFESRKEIL
ncbi:hypothetical protein MC885_005617 [Smutsia gigantea]|nr:hypothetical protein MC885_005617 [Smutsia gigantea]